MRTLTLKDTIRILDTLLHVLSLTIGIIAGAAITASFPNMYIGKASLVYVCFIGLLYLISRFTLCRIFKPVVKWMSN